MDSHPVETGNGKESSSNSSCKGSAPVEAGKIKTNVTTSAPVEEAQGKDKISPIKHLREVSLRTGNTGLNLVIQLSVNGVPLEAIVDTAAQVSLINEGVVEKMQSSLQFSESVCLREAGENSRMTAQKASQVPLGIGGRRYLWDIYVAPIADCCILGIDFLNAFHGVINLGDKTLTLENKVK